MVDWIKAGSVATVEEVITLSLRMFPEIGSPLTSLVTDVVVVVVATPGNTAALAPRGAAVRGAAVPKEFPRSIRSGIPFPFMSERVLCPVVAAVFFSNRSGTPFMLLS
jgi:hypothetical protein